MPIRYQHVWPDGGLRSRLRCHRELKEERGAFADDRFDVDVALQRVHAIGDDGQAQSQSGRSEFSVAFGMPAIEARKD